MTRGARGAELDGGQYVGLSVDSGMVVIQIGPNGIEVELKGP